MLKKEKGITLISLIIYVIAMTLIIAVVANISRSFYKNMTQFSDTDSIEFKVEKFNTFFLNQINTSSIYVSSCNETNITFSDGTKYVYKNNAIYYEKDDKSIKLCDEIDSLRFSHEASTQRVNLNISDGTNSKTIVYKKK